MFNKTEKKCFSSEPSFLLNLRYGKLNIGGFSKIPEKSLYPDNDPIFKLCQDIKDIAVREFRVGDIGDFLRLWAELEEIIVTTARTKSEIFKRERSNKPTLQKRNNFKRFVLQH